ncbi:TfoX/Sxy family protein [Spirochaeta africana]|uniref:Regulator of competence-specific genes n=1 Tax=Spirochaeta africana (strain ATCC 700263 / DSM 8902 / Z-7692) TaxID=889378 RepID=H9UG48_SPIAZ|nr:TfoX/Sxy family protein [Spirochaeta africana]AFG36491.1 regulator of competence-specific genes [Spirochaeta africana DSM 8902]
MASSQEIVDFICEQIQDAGEIRSRKMFGEYAVYCNNKVIGLICQDSLYIKPTKAGRAYIGVPTEVPPYNGAKPYFLVEDQVEDREWLSELVRQTEQELPPPKKRTS